jgi:hypothetical protein
MGQEGSRRKSPYGVLASEYFNHKYRSFVGVAVVGGTAAGLAEAVFFVEGNGALVRLANFEKKAIDSRAPEFGNGFVEKRFGEPRTALFWGYAEIEEFSFGDDRLHDEETGNLAIVLDHPAEFAAQIDLLERFHAPRRRFRRTSENFSDSGRVACIEPSDRESHLGFRLH